MAAQRIVESAVTLPAHGAVTGWADLHWRGGRWFDGTTAGGRERRRVPLVVAGSNLRATEIAVPSKERLALVDVEVIDGLRVTTAARSVLFEMRYAATWRQAVRAFDLAAFNDLVSVSEVTSYLEGVLNGWTGVPQAREALPHLDENTWSPTEVDMRLVWTIDGGHPRPLANRPLFDSAGHHLATPDLIDPVSGVVGEYDGAVHFATRSRDLDREASYRALGLEPVTMVAADLVAPQRFLARLEQAYAAAAARPAGERRWTVTPPPWWTSTTTVAARRSLTSSQRHLLRHRSRAAA